MSLFSQLKEGLKRSSEKLRRGTAALFVRGKKPATKKREKAPDVESPPVKGRAIPPAEPATVERKARAEPQAEPRAEPQAEPRAEPQAEPQAKADLQKLEDLLLSADLGVKVTDELIKNLRKSPPQDERECRRRIAEMLEAMLQNSAAPGLLGKIGEPKPFVVLFVGNNGSGKTTTIGKLAAHLSKKGKKVVLAAADTFRAAASEQLALWAKKSKAEVVESKTGSDPAAVAFEGYRRAETLGADYLFIDTAGRQHTNPALMAELEKLNRVLKKLDPKLPHLCLLVIDSGAGINAVTVAAEFKNAVAPGGLIITKLDTEAKGGAVVNLWQKLQIPIYALGIGEEAEQWLEFEPGEFVTALLDP